MSIPTPEARLLKLKVVDLKQILSKASLPQNGVKQDLVARILGSKEALVVAGLGEESVSTDAGVAAEASSTPKLGQNPASKPAPSAEATVTTENGSKSLQPQAAETSNAAERKAPLTAKTPETEEERKKVARAARFGISIETKPQTRVPSSAQPMPCDSAPKSSVGRQLADDEEKMKKRAERFGIPFVANADAKPSTSGTAPKPNGDSPVMNSATLEEEKKRKRAERFAGAGAAGKKAKVDV